MRAKKYDATSQTMLIDVKGSVVTINKMDLLTKEYIGSPYVIDVSKLVNGESYDYITETLR